MVPSLLEDLLASALAGPPFGRRPSQWIGLPRRVSILHVVVLAAVNPKMMSYKYVILHTVSPHVLHSKCTARAADFRLSRGVVHRLWSTPCTAEKIFVSFIVGVSPRASDTCQGAVG